MKLKLEISPDLAALMQAEIVAGERAVSAAMREAGTSLKSAWRGQITGAGLGARLARPAGCLGLGDPRADDRAGAGVAAAGDQEAVARRRREAKLLPQRPRRFRARVDSHRHHPAHHKRQRVSAYRRLRHPGVSLNFEHVCVYSLACRRRVLQCAVFPLGRNFFASEGTEAVWRYV